MGAVFTRHTRSSAPSVDSLDPFALAADAMNVHQCLHPLFAHTQALIAQRTPYTGPAITAAALSVSGLDMDEQRFIVQISTLAGSLLIAHSGARADAP